MNDRMTKQIHEDYREILSTDAGKRTFGGIFFAARMNDVNLMTDFIQGRRSMGQSIANTIREVDPCLLGECEKAYEEMIKELDDGRDEYDNGR